MNKNEYETVLKVNEGDNFYVNIKDPIKSQRESEKNHSKSYFARPPSSQNNNKKIKRGREMNHLNGNKRVSNQRFHSNFKRGSGERSKFNKKRSAFGNNQIHNDNMVQMNSIAKKLNSSHKRESALFKLKRKNSKNVDLVNLDLGGRRKPSPKYSQINQNSRGKWGMKNSKDFVK